MNTIETLLDVQDHDTAVDRLRHRRTHLPEREDLAGIEKRAAELEARLVATKDDWRDLEQRQGALESEVATIDHRIQDIEKRMYSGEVSATRDLLAMTAEIDALKTRGSGLEDDALASVEAAEPLAEEASTIEQQLASLGAEAAALRSAIAAAEEEIDGLLVAEFETRRAAAGRLEPELLATYEKLRTELGGVGAARLVGTSCSGCHLTLPASELARIKREPPDTLVFCDQCGRILVR